MKSERFDEIVEARLAACKDVLCAKNKEYSSDTDRLHNFKLAAAINSHTPEQAAWGMATKHLVSIIDMINDPEKQTETAINEKIGDMINYLLLTEAIMMETKQ